MLRTLLYRGFRNADELVRGECLCRADRNLSKCLTGSAVIGVDDRAHAIVGRGFMDVGFETPQDAPIG